MPPGHGHTNFVVRKHAAGVDMGDGDFAIKYNRNGRPIRNCAGKKKSPGPDYVDLQALDEELSDFGEEFFLEEELDEVDEEEEPPKKKRKRRRSPSPTPPPLSPLPLEDPDSREASPQPLDVDVPPKRLFDLEPITFNFNIAPGFTGPLEVKIDFSNIPLRVKRARPCDGPMPFSKPPKVESQPFNKSKIGFLTLPPELRNKVYHLLFKHKDKFDFSTPNNTQRSAAFLRTCKQVHEEGRTILYGENSFYFGRNKEMRRVFWAGERKEIGYKDLRHFLEKIGPSNVSYMRHLWLCFDDATPSGTPHLKRCEERRYVHDGHLIECLKVLAKQARLKKLTITFWGRRALALTDTRFLDHFCKIKADAVEMKQPFTDTYYWHAPSRVHEDAKALVIKEITRKQKLYTEE